MCWRTNAIARRRREAQAAAAALLPQTNVPRSRAECDPSQPRRASLELRLDSTRLDDNGTSDDMIQFSTLHTIQAIFDECTSLLDSRTHASDRRKPTKPPASIRKQWVAAITSSPIKSAPAIEYGGGVGARIPTMPLITRRDNVHGVHTWWCGNKEIE